MRETTKCQNEVQGADPATGGETRDQNPSGIQQNTEHCSVETAKPLPRLADDVDVKVRGVWRRGYVFKKESADEFGEEHFKVWCEDVEDVNGVADEAMRVAASDEGETWRWPVLSAETRCEKHDEFKPCNGCECEREPEAECEKHEESRPCAGCECEQDATHFAFEDTVKDAMKPAPEGRCEVCKVQLVAGDQEDMCFVCFRFAQGRLQPEIPEEEEQPNDKQPASPPVVRTCGVADCATILGDDCVEDMCSVHRRTSGECMRRGCERRRMKGSVWCAGHERIAKSTTDADKPFGELSTLFSSMFDFEAAWQQLAEDSENDPLSVARCKRVHDMQMEALGMRGGKR
jgi:hypothetical protein